jgi:tetratricopeptide (TPR) repeat protein
MFRFHLVAGVLIVAALATPLRCTAQSNSSQLGQDWERDPQVIHDFEQGLALRRAGKLEEAASAYERVLAHAPKLAVAHLNLGLVRHDEHNYADSTAEFERAASLDPSLHQAYLYLGIDAYLWRHDALARKALETAARYPPQAFESNYWLGVVETRQGDFQAAAGSLQTALQLRPKDEDALFQLDEVYLQLWKSTYDRMTAVDPDSFRVHQVLAEGFVQSGDLDKAKREYTLVLQRNPHLTGIHEPLGDIARGQEHLPEALREYRAELKLDPENFRVWSKMADLLAASGDFSGAAQAAHSAIALNPNFGPPYCVLGRVAAQEGKSKEAIADFEKALELGVSDELKENAHYRLFRLLMASGQTAEANAHQAEYLRLQKAHQQRALAIARGEHALEQSTNP